MKLRHALILGCALLAGALVASPGCVDWYPPTMDSQVVNTCLAAASMRMTELESKNPKTKAEKRELKYLKKVHKLTGKVYDPKLPVLVRIGAALKVMDAIGKAQSPLEEVNLLFVSQSDIVSDLIGEMDPKLRELKDQLDAALEAKVDRLLDDAAAKFARAQAAGDEKTEWKYLRLAIQLDARAYDVSKLFRQ